MDIRTLFKYIIFFLFIFPVFLPDSSLAQDKYLLALVNDNGKILFKQAIRNNDQFAIRFTHSVAKTPVTDYFMIRDGKIFLDKTIYHDFGAGLPHAPEDGQKMKAEHGEISITGFNREIPDLEVRVGRIANHKLLLFQKSGKTREIPLKKLSKPGSVIIFKIIPFK